MILHFFGVFDLWSYTCLNRGEDTWQNGYGSGEEVKPAQLLTTRGPWQSELMVFVIILSNYVDGRPDHELIKD